MITARLAVEQNRTLFAIPANPSDRVNTGTNLLIKHGAIFCTEPNDICNEFIPRYGNRISPVTVRFEPTTAETPSQPPAKAPQKKAKEKPEDVRSSGF